MRNQATKRHEGSMASIVLSERNESDKAAACMIPSLGHVIKGTTIETLRRSVLTSQAWWCVPVTSACGKLR
jgi:hypothetical protein